MKIDRVKTSAFAISESLEKKLKAKKNQKTHRAYIPLGRLHILKTKGTTKGVLFKKSATDIIRNNIYIDLSDLSIMHFTSKGIMRKKPNLKKLDILRRLAKIPETEIRTLSSIWEKGSLQYTGFEKDILIDLIHRGFIIAYEPGENQIMNLIKIATDEKIITTQHVKPTFNIPKQMDRRYDLSNFLEITDEISEDYTRQKISFPIKQVENLLSIFFNCNATLEEITYLPQIIYEKQGGSERSHADIYYPVCLKGCKNRKKLDNAEKLTAMSLSTELHSDDSVPVEQSSTTFSNLGGLYEAKQEIMESLVYPLIKPELSKKFGKKTGGGLLLYGPPGCGKTHLAKAAVTECGVSFFNVNISDVLNGEGDEAKKIHSIFDDATQNAPAIIFFDEIDALCSSKGSSDESKKKVLNQFLIDMSGIEDISKGVLVIAATNVPWELDPALRRSGRFTKKIYVPPPDHRTRKDILELNSKGRPISADIDFDLIAKLTEGYAGADLEEISNIAASIPWKNALYGSTERDITTEDFIQAIKMQESSLIAWSLIAEKQIAKSGEEELYPQLFETIKELNKKFRKTDPLNDLPKKSPKANTLFLKKKDITYRIQLLEKKYSEGQIDEESYDNMLRAYNKDLQDIESQIKNIK